MFFLLRMAFWVSIVLVLLPSGGSKQQAVVPSAQVGAADAVSAASATVSDMRQFCSRQAEACAIGSQAAIAFGQRAQAGAKMVYDFISERNERSAPRETGSVSSNSTRQAATRSARETLTPDDLAPVWHGQRPEAHSKRAD